MDRNDLDRRFDELLERLTSDKKPSISPFGTPVQAADQQLLQRSWDYFRERVKAIEEQWAKLLEAKQAQNTALTTQLNEAMERIRQLEDENKMLNAMDGAIVQARTRDHLQFGKDAESLRIRWDEEREVLQRKVDDLEFHLSKAKEDLAAARSRWQERVGEYQSTLDEKREQACELADRIQETEHRWMEETARKDQRIEELEIKFDVITKEMERRDIMLREASETAALKTRLSDDLSLRLSEREGELQAMREMENLLRAELNLLKKDKENLLESWQREQAEWRELWDRQRQMWEQRPKA